MFHVNQYKILLDIIIEFYGYFWVGVRKFWNRDLYFNSLILYSNTHFDTKVFKTKKNSPKI